MPRRVESHRNSFGMAVDALSGDVWLQENGEDSHPAAFDDAADDAYPVKESSTPYTPSTLYYAMRALLALAGLLVTLPVAAQPLTVVSSTPAPGDGSAAARRAEAAARIKAHAGEPPAS